MSSRGAKKTGRPTIHDVAADAGVSAITVSRALRTPHLVSSPLRDNIAASIERLGYVSNRIAGNLSAGRSNVVAVVVPNLRNAFFSSMIDAMSAILEPAGFQILIASSRYELAMEDRLIESVLGWHPAGIVLVGCDRPREMRTRLRQSGVLVIETWDLRGDPVDTLIGFSHHAVGEAIAAHLIECGYKRIASIGAALTTDVRAAARVEGFRNKLHTLGLQPVAEVVVDELATVERGCRALGELLARAPKTDAVFCSNDILAVGTLFEAQRRGVRVPRDLAIAGFGDLDASGWTVPPLTTVRPPGDEIGRRAAELIVRRAQASGARPRRRARIDVGFTLVVRESTRSGRPARALERAIAKSSPRAASAG